RRRRARRAMPTYRAAKAIVSTKKGPPEGGLVEVCRLRRHRRGGSADRLGSRPPARGGRLRGSVNDLAVLVDVETLDLFLVADAQADDDVDDLEDDPGRDRTVDDRG